MPEVTGQRHGDERISDKRLAEAAAEGDTRASTVILKRMAPRMLAAVRSVLGRDHPEVEDTTQQALIALIQSLSRFRGDSRLSSYAIRIAVNAAIACRRRGARHVQKQDEFARLREVLEATQGPAEAVLANRRRALVRELVARLPAVQAEVLGLHVVMGMRCREVAEVTGVSVNTVKSRLRLAKTAMRRAIDRDPGVASLLEVGR